MKQTLILFFTTLVVFFASDVHGQTAYAVNGTVNITLSGCGVTKLCLQTPDGCDPAGNGTCLFASNLVKNLSTSAFSFQLSGNSTGYIGITLAKNVSQGSLLFACTNSSVISAYNISGNITSLNPVNVTTVQGQASGNNIQCQFDVVGLNVSNSLLRSLDTSFYVQVVSGLLKSDGSLNNTLVRDFGFLDLANPAANLATTSAPSNTTAASNTTASGASCALHSEAVLFLVSILSLSILNTV